MMKVNCSSIGSIMTNGRKAGELSETCKTEIRKIWIQNTYGRKEIIFSKYMTKGNECEEDSLTLYTQVTGQLAIKNEKRYENDYIKGYPDALSTNQVIEIKTPWDLWTYMKSDITSDYEWQMRGYMMLTGLEQATLAYCLVDTPEKTITSEINRMQWQYMDADGNISPDFEPDRMQTIINMKFKDIDAELRVKTFTIQRNMELEEAMIKRIEEAREFYNKLTLKPKTT